MKRDNRDQHKLKEWYYDAVLGGLVLTGMMKDEAVALMDEYKLKEKLDKYPDVQLHYDIDGVVAEIYQLRKNGRKPGDMNSVNAYINNVNSYEREMYEYMKCLSLMRNFVKDVNNVAESLNCDPRKVCELMERDYQEYIDAVAIIEDDLE